MSEKEELAKLAKRKEKIERKYGRIAKKRLHYLNKKMLPNIDFLDGTEKDFEAVVANDLMRSNVRLSKLNDLIFPNSENDLATMSNAEFEKQLTRIEQVFDYYRRVNSNQNQQQLRQNNN